MQATNFNRSFSYPDIRISGYILYFFVQLKFIVALQEKQSVLSAPVPVCSISVVLTAVCVLISHCSHHHLIPVLRSMTTGIFKQASSPAMHHSSSPEALLPSEELTAAFQLASLNQTCCRNLTTLSAFPMFLQFLWQRLNKIFSKTSDIQGVFLQPWEVVESLRFPVWTLAEPSWKPQIWIVSRSTDRTNQPPNERRVRTTANHCGAQVTCCSVHQWQLLPTGSTGCEEIWFACFVAMAFLKHSTWCVRLVRPELEFSFKQNFLTVSYFSPVF